MKQKSNQNNNYKQEPKQQREQGRKQLIVISALEKNAILVNKKDRSRKSVQFFTISDEQKVIQFKSFCLFSGPRNEQLLKNISVQIRRNCTTAIIGKSGSGKSCLVRSLNRINEEMVSNFSISGDILFDGRSIYDIKQRVHKLRKDIGMVFQKPLPFNMSIYNNILYPLKINGVRNKGIQHQLIIQALKDVGLYDEVSDKLSQSALQLSGGQQQRLCIARAICLNPKVILFDEPTSALDPLATRKIEDLINKLAQKYTIILVTHSLKQAIRISKYTMYMDKGEVIEYNHTYKLMNRPKYEKTIEFIENEE